MADKSTLPAGLSVRPATWSDLNSVLALSNAVDVAAYGEPDTDLVDLRDSWADLDLSKDAWLVENPFGDLIAYAAVFPDAEEVILDFFTSPEVDTPGLSAYLLSRCERRAHKIRSENEGYPVRAVAILPHVSYPERDLLAGSGFRPRKYYYQMHITLDSAPEDPQWPDGVSLRPFEPGTDEVPVYEFIQIAFDRPGYRRPTFDRWRDFMVGSGRFDPSLWFLLVVDREIIGAVLSYDYGDLGWVRQLAVAPDWRRKGLGAALLRQSFREFFIRGRFKVALGVSAENPQAIELYRRVGMIVFRQYDEYFKVLAA